MTFDELFEPEPSHWGLRGDPYLWRAMKAHFTDARCPTSTTDLQAMLSLAFEALTGHALDHPTSFSVEGFQHGGLSSGMISPQFWQETAIPLLTARLPTPPAEPQNPLK